MSVNYHFLVGLEITNTTKAVAIVKALVFLRSICRYPFHYPAWGRGDSWTMHYKIALFVCFFSFFFFLFFRQSIL
jgi:hypothetical protein